MLRLLLILCLFVLNTSLSVFSLDVERNSSQKTDYQVDLEDIDHLRSPTDSALLVELKALQQAINDSDQKRAIESHFNLGIIYYRNNKFNQADYHFGQSLLYAKELNDDNSQAIALNRLGNVNQLKTNYLQALDYYSQALKINKKTNNKAEVGRTLVNLANVYSIIGQYQRSIEHFLEAMDIHESIGEREGVAWASLGIARLFKRLDLLERAMQYAQTSWELYKEIELKTGNSIGVTLSLSELGSIYHKQGDFEKALEYTQMVLDINTVTQNIHGQAANHLALGVIFFDRNQNNLAQSYLVKARTLKASVGDSLDLAVLYRYLGNVEMRKGNSQKAQDYFSQSLHYAHKLSLIPEISESYLSLSDVYSKLGKQQKALAAFKNYTAYKDSLNSNDIARLEMQYEFEKREKEQELLARQREALQHARLERQRVVTIFFIVAFILAGSLAAFIFFGYREKKRINQVLLQQNNEIIRQKTEIESQKEEIEQQRDFVTRQRDQIADQQRLITDSITYASRIQNAVLPSRELKQLPWDSFVLYKPKNIVSGDFYWVSEFPNGKILIAVADCTGHGVPGAFMSMLGITLLREISGKEDATPPSEMLVKMREMVIRSLNQQGGKVDQADGMDMALAIINPKTLEMDYAGAYLSVVIIRKGETTIDPEVANPRILNQNGLSLIEYRGDKMPIGHHIAGFTGFTNYTTQLQKGDSLYLFSDGYIDQFGGERNVKFLYHNFRNLLLTVNHHDLLTQKEILISTIENYKGDRKQVDDMLVLGLKI